MKLDVAGRRAMEVGEGNGPVNALDAALRKALIPVYPELRDMRLVDFKVRILDSAGGTAATTRVMIESDGKGRRWSTIGVSPNIVDASYNALYDAITSSSGTARSSGWRNGCHAPPSVDGRGTRADHIACVTERSKSGGSAYITAGPAAAAVGKRRSSHAW